MQRLVTPWEYGKNKSAEKRLLSIVYEDERLEQQPDEDYVQWLFRATQWLVEHSLGGNGDEGACGAERA